jgi:hypothetical protein
MVLAKKKENNRYSGGKKPNSKQNKDTKEVTIWSYTGSTRHREGTKRIDRTSERRRSESEGTRGSHGRII